MTYAVILAGGSGERLGGKKPKQFLPLGNKSIIVNTIEIFQILKEVDLIIPVLPGDYLDAIDADVKKWKLTKILRVVQGGVTRQGSVYNALNAVSYNAGDVIIFHDAARPFVPQKTITGIIENALENGAAGTYVSAIDTIAEIESGSVKSIPPRKNLYYTQTPQGFRYRIIKDAHEKALKKGITNATDDVSIVIDAGYEVKMVEGSYLNFKITTQEDYLMAKNLMQNRNLKSY